MPEQPETTEVQFTLAKGPLRMNASLRVPTSEVTLTQLLPVLQEFTNDVVGGIASALQQSGETISCRAGCGACCRQMVPLSLFEAESLAAWIRTLPSERQAELATRFAAAVEQLRERGILARLGPGLWSSTRDESERLGIEYLQARVACPFLEDESCSIHPIRPLICREYLVTSPAEFCFIPVPEKVERIKMPLKPSNGLFRLGAKVENRGRGWIPLVMLGEWMKSEGHPGDSVSGLGPDVVYTFLRELAGPEEDPA